MSGQRQGHRGHAPHPEAKPDDKTGAGEGGQDAPASPPEPGEAARGEPYDYYGEDRHGDDRWRAGSAYLNAEQLGSEGAHRDDAAPEEPEDDPPPDPRD